MTTTFDTTQSDSTQIAVVTQEKRRRPTVPLVAAAAGAVLLGSTTFALWSATDTIAGGSIQAGDLNIAGPNDAVYYDVSTDRNDETTPLPGTGSTVMGHAVEPTWHIVPGDKVAAVFTADVTLDGDNLVAKVSLSGIGDGALAITGMDYTYAVYHKDTVVIPETPLPSGNPDLLYLAAPEGQGGNDDADPTGTPKVIAMTNTTESVTVVVYGTFDKDTSGRQYAALTDVLGDLTLTLSQVRTGGSVFQP